MVAYVTLKRDDGIRAQEQERADEIRALDREQASKDLQAALEHQEASMRATWEFERQKQHDEEGREAARHLLSKLRVIRDSFDEQTPDAWGYKLRREQRNSVEDAALVVPDPALRHFALDVVEAIDYVVYAVERGMYQLDNVPATQRNLLIDLMREVGSYAASNRWDVAQAATASDVADAIERTHRDVLAEEEWERREQGGS